MIQSIYTQTEKQKKYWFDEDGYLHRVETGGLDEAIYEKVK